MEIISKTKRQLVKELEVLQQRLVELEKEEAERKRAEELFQNLALSSPVGIYIAQDGKFGYTGEIELARFSLPWLEEGNRQ